MTRLTEHEIAELTGRAAPQQEVPATKHAAALAKLKDLDERIAQRVEKERQMGESHVAAHARIMVENPALYENYKAAKRDLLAAHDIGSGDTSLLHR
jgi:hypothetical protein